MKNIPAYKTSSIQTKSKKIRFLFESKGKKSIIKAIEYAPLRTSKGTTLYNLAFGDYNEVTDAIMDDINSNNGDMRRVFSTVLHSVPLFFAKTEQAALWVQGSDSEETFRKKCELNCSKNCNNTCKNQGRRIKTYRYYIDKNFRSLCEEYIFFGLSEDGKQMVQYVPGSDYQGILIYKKK